MVPADLHGVMAVADVVHPTFPERIDVFAEKLALFPAGCLVLVEANAAAGVIGYAVSHPWPALSIPPLDDFLGSLPSPEANRYIHDVALLPAGRGHGAASEAVASLLAEAGFAGARTASLVSVYGSAPFWRRHGFRDATPGMLPPDEAEKLPRVYGAEAVFMQRAL
jgi:GNAT superfamily N-acetyltransferase